MIVLKNKKTVGKSPIFGSYFNYGYVMKVRKRPFIVLLSKIIAKSAKSYYICSMRLERF